MGRFEERLAKGMQDPEFAEWYRDAVLEFYQSSVAVSAAKAYWAIRHRMMFASKLRPWLAVQATNRQIKLNFMLADAAQIQQGKLFVLGAAATMRTPESTLMAICGTVSIPWDFTNRQHVVAASLLAGDQPFMVDTPLGLQEWKLEARLEAGRPPGFPHGGNLVIPFAAQFRIPNLRVGVYEFQFSVNGEDDIDSAITMVVVPGAAPIEPSS